MSTLKVINSIHPSGSTNNLVFDSSGNTTAGGTLAMSSSFSRNRIINGDMRIDQRNAGASVTPTTIGATYTLDRWAATNSQASKYSVQQSSNAPTTQGFYNSLAVTSLSSYSVGASDYFYLTQPIEGYNVADLMWGTANAKTVTLSFWVRSSLTGTFVVAFRSGSDDAAYPATYTISSANTWEKKTITVPGPTSGTYSTTTGKGFVLWFSLGAGSGFNATANTWSNGVSLSVSGSQSVVGTNGATFYLTGVQLEVGSVATPYEYELISQTLAKCYRYFEKSFPLAIAPAHNTGYFVATPNAGSLGCAGNTYTTITPRASKRTTPSIRIYDPMGAAAAGTNAFRSYTACNAGTQSTTIGLDFITTDYFGGYFQLVTGGSIAFHWTADAEL